MQHKDYITTRLLNENLLAEQLLNVDLNGLVPFLTELVNHAMWLPKQDFIGVIPHEHNRERRADDNGYKPKKCKSPIETLNL